jgi:ABC-type branched-subunit amino acid transport system substrate-binding protein
MRIRLGTIAAVLLLAAASVDALVADEVLDLDIRIGNVMPYTGELAPFATIGKAEAAYFDMINAQGGINGRKVRFISYDDGADPVASREATRKLVETDKVLLMFGSFGTPENLAVRAYLN